MKQVASYGTWIVLAHLLVNIVHGTAHFTLQILLGPAGTVFVLGVIGIAPLLAMSLLWTRHQRFGLLLLALSMAGSLLFGLYNHFVAMGPDHVGEQGSNSWGAAFAITAYLLLLTEALGAYVGWHFWRQNRRVSGP